MALRLGQIASLCVLSAAVLCGPMLPAHAFEEPELPDEAASNALWFEVSASFTTDYVFRGVSQTAENPAVQPEFVVGYDIFYAGMWGSNVDWGSDIFTGKSFANVEIDYFVGVAPEWKDISFDIYGIYYTFPNACEAECGIRENDYFELSTSAAYTFGEKWQIKAENFWTWENFNETGQANALELSTAYTFNDLWIFTPSLRGLVGWQYYEELDSYTYWNVGFDLNFLGNWTASIDYWDTAGLTVGGLICGDSSVFACDARVVGTLASKFEF